MKICCVWFMAIILMFCLSATSYGSLVSTFDINNEGWEANGVSADWQSFGGNPGGHIYDNLSIDFYGSGGTIFDAPTSTWNGNWTKYIDGTICFDYRIERSWTDPPSSEQYSFNIVIGKADYNYIYTSSSIITESMNAWHRANIPIAASEFYITPSDSFEDIIANVSYFRIFLDVYAPFGSDLEIRLAIDNVGINPVPIPPAILFLGTGLVCLLGFRRKFRKR